MCGECLFAFFQSPLKMGMVTFSFSLSILAFVLLRKLRDISSSKKIMLLYVHLFAFVFPFLFYLFFRGCQSLFQGCDKTKGVIYLVLLTAFVAAVIAVVASPLLFRQMYIRKSAQMTSGYIRSLVARKSKELMIQEPKLFAVDAAKPLAFSVSLFKPAIFLSVGLIELLTKNELKAVVLHEIAHLKNRSSLLKLSASITKLFSPVAHLAEFQMHFDDEEEKADSYVVIEQRTDTYLTSARQKIIGYNNELQLH